jgi:hypothetical protein
MAEISEIIQFIQEQPYETDIIEAIVAKFPDVDAVTLWQVSDRLGDVLFEANMAATTVAGAWA